MAFLNMIFLCLFRSVNPMKMITGLSAMTAIWGECIYLFSERESLLKIKRSYPQVGIVLTVICAGFVVYTINSVVFLLFSILLSLCGKSSFYNK